MDETKIMPLVALTAEVAKNLAEGIAHRPISPRLSFIYGWYEDGDAVALVQTTAKAPIDDLHELALQNLDQLQFDIQQHGANFGLHAEHHAAALIARPDLWLDRVGLTMETTAVVLLGTDVILVGDRTNPFGLQAMFDTAGFAEDDVAPLSPEVYGAGLPLEVISGVDLERQLQSLSTAYPRWHNLGLLAVYVICLIRAMNVVGEAVHDRGWDATWSWRWWGMIVAIPFLVNFALDLWTPFDITKTVQVQGLTWIAQAVMFAACLGLCIFVIEAMATSYGLCAVGIVVSGIQAWRHWEVSKRTGALGI